MLKHDSDFMWAIDSYLVDDGVFASPNFLVDMEIVHIWIINNFNRTKSHS